ncbi:MULTISPECIES: hypothetical protein [Kordiimonas]|uniref:hypothetical protein n=1 Tax=Kordiimonas TaxID=288021 RepID=UPI00257E77A6|nr:hypothetical protein [Kordiimonas sp. UBA4487]
MRLIGKIGFYVAVAIAMYLTALWGWGIWLYVLAIPVGLIAFLVGILLLIVAVGGTKHFFSKRKTHPFIRQPQNEMEAAMLLQKILNTAEDPAYSDWPVFEPNHLAWARFIWDQGVDCSGQELKALIQEVADVEARYAYENEDYDYETGAAYSSDEIRTELYRLVSTWFERASKVGHCPSGQFDYLRQDEKILPSPASRIMNRILQRQP